MRRKKGLGILVPIIAVALAVPLAAGCASTHTAPTPIGTSDATFALPAISTTPGYLEAEAPVLTLASFDPAALMATAAAAPVEPDPLSAAEPAPEEPEDETPPEEKRWTYYLEAAASVSGGNTVTRDLDARFDIKRKWERDEVSIFGRVEYGEAENDEGDLEKNKNRLTGGAQYNRTLDEDGSLYGFVRQNFERDTFSDIRFRSETWVGVGDILYSDDHHEVKGEAAPGYVATDYFNDRNRSDFSARLWEGWIWKISEDWTFDQALEFISNLENWDDDFRTTLTADLRTQLTENLFLSFGIEHRYDAEPGRDDDGDRLKRQDYKAMIKLGFSF
jgi:hypothetical protein